MPGHPGAYSYVREDCPGIFNAASGQKIEPNGFTAGGQAGYNWQWESVVFGLEWDWRKIHKSKNSIKRG